MRLILKKSPGCQTLSKAWLMSRKAAIQYWWFSVALFMVSARRWHCCIVECRMTPYLLAHITSYTWEWISVRVWRRAGNGTRLNRGKFWCIAGVEVGTFVVPKFWPANLFGMQFQLGTCVRDVFYEWKSAAMSPTAFSVCVWDRT